MNSFLAKRKTSMFSSELTLHHRQGTASRDDPTLRTTASTRFGFLLPARPILATNKFRLSLRRSRAGLVDLRGKLVLLTSVSMALENSVTDTVVCSDRVPAVMVHCRVEL